MTILSSFWVTKKYPVSDKVFRFFIGTSQINMLNTLEAASGKKFTQLVVNEHSRDRWTATDPTDPNIEYTVERRDDQPELPKDITTEPYSIRDERIPAPKFAPRGPKVKLTFC